MSARADTSAVADLETAKAAHDRLLEAMPEGAVHDADVCDYCSDGISDKELPMADEAKDETKTKLDEATAALAAAEAEIAELKRASADSEIQARIDEATAELTAQVAELSAAVEAKDAELKAERDARAEEKAALEAAAAAAAAEELKATRLEEVKAAGVYTDEFFASDIATSAVDRWAGMSDTEWANQKAEWALLRPAAAAAEKPDPNEDPAKDTLPPVSPLSAAADTAGSTGSAVLDLIAHRRAAMKSA